MAIPLEQAQEICKSRDYSIFVDESLSMNTGDCPDRTSRWNFVAEVVGLIAAVVSKYDDDGIDLTLFGGKTPKVYRGITPAQLSESIPSGPSAMSTYLGQALDDEFNHYFTSGNPKPLTVLVLTDGQSTDPAVVERALRNAAKAAQDGDRIAVGFWQIGYDSGAAKELQRLDDELGEIDITDYVLMSDLIANLGQIEVLMANAVID